MRRTIVTTLLAYAALMALAQTALATVVNIH
jgi:hypothetical protein